MTNMFQQDKVAKTTTTTTKDKQELVERDKEEEEEAADTISESSALDDSCPANYPWSMVLLLVLSTVTVVIIFVLFSLLYIDTANGSGAGGVNNNNIVDANRNYVQFYEPNEFAFKLPNKLSSAGGTSRAHTLPTPSDRCNQSPTSSRPLPLRTRPHNQLGYGQSTATAKKKKEQANVNLDCLSPSEGQAKTSLTDSSSPLTHHHHHRRRRRRGRRFDAAHRSSSWMSSSSASSSSADHRTPTRRPSKSIHYVLGKAITTTIAPTTSNFGLSPQPHPPNPKKYYRWPGTSPTPARRYQAFNSLGNGHRPQRNKTGRRRLFTTTTTTTTTALPATETHSGQFNLTTNGSEPSTDEDEDEEDKSPNCDQWITSDQGLNGTITSPGFPQPYATRLKCQYHFVGRGKERVQIIFEEFDIFKVEDQHRDCEISDSLTAYTHTNGQKEWIDDFCGRELPPQLMSNGPRLILEFKSLNHNRPNVRSSDDGDEGEERKRRRRSRRRSSGPLPLLAHQQSQPSSSYPDFTLEMTAATESALGQQQQQPLGLRLQNEKLAKSEINYARPIGTGREEDELKDENVGHAIDKARSELRSHDHHHHHRAQLELADFGEPTKLVRPNDNKDWTLAGVDNDNTKTQEDDDDDVKDMETETEAKDVDNQSKSIKNMLAKDRVKRKSKADKKQQQQSKSKTKHHSQRPRQQQQQQQQQQSSGRPLAKGFRAIYRFVTDFGIDSGQQDSKAVCGFIYNSTNKRSGVFTSPNHPGYYPKDTECHYFFYGKANERVFIKFSHFDVEGVTPCTLETASDYIEFSNFYSADRKMHRHCGLKDPKHVESEGDFFRVTFKSNGRFDGTGFRATYEFRTTKAPPKKKIQNSVSTSMSTSGGSAPRSAGAWRALLLNTSLLFYSLLTFLD